MSVARPLSVAFAVTGVVALLSFLLPPEWQSTGVGLCLVGATYLLVLRGDAAHIRHHGLGMGGLFEPVPLEARRLAAALWGSVRWALCCALLFFPPFWLGFVLWWSPLRAFQWPAPPGVDLVLTQLLGIAVPEEMFYRGYVQTALDDAFPSWRFQLFGATIGAGVILGSLIFAVGHFATHAHPARLTVFFPSLVFGWLRARTGGVGASVFFHASCNLYSAYLTDGYYPHH
jgi:membrane protease YdiL (CAAX protease family)